MPWGWHSNTTSKHPKMVGATLTSLANGFGAKTQRFPSRNGIERRSPERDDCSLEHATKCSPRSPEHLTSIQPVHRSPDMILTSGGRGGHFHRKKAPAASWIAATRLVKSGGGHFHRKRSACGKQVSSNRACQSPDYSCIIDFDNHKVTFRSDRTPMHRIAVQF